MNNGFLKGSELQETEISAGKRIRLRVRFFDWWSRLQSMPEPVDESTEVCAPSPSTCVACCTWGDRTGDPTGTGGLCGALSRMC